MYKLRFNTWGVTKYNRRKPRVARTDKSSKGKSSNGDDLSQGKSEKSRDEPVRPPNLDYDPGRGVDVEQSPPGDFRSRPMQPTETKPMDHATEQFSSLLCIGNHFSTVSPTPSVTAMSLSPSINKVGPSDASLLLTPNSYRITPNSGIRTPNSQPRTPDSHNRGVDIFRSNHLRSDLDSASAVLNPSLPPPTNEWQSIPRSFPAPGLPSITDDPSSIRQTLLQGLGQSSPFNRISPSYANDGLRHEKIPQFTLTTHKSQSMESPAYMARISNDRPPSPDFFTDLCFRANLYASQDNTSAANVILGRAAAVYQRLVLQENDEILSILNLVFAIIYLLGNKQLAEDIIWRARSAASDVLDSEDPILHSIAFTHACAKEESTSSENEVWRLRQIRNQMSRQWSEDHKHTIVADYNLAWSLSYDKSRRREALELVVATYARAERAFGSGHIQTIAFLLVRARMQAYLRQYFDAAESSALALNRIKNWDIKEDYPYYQAAQERDQWFQERRFRRVVCP